MNRDSGAACTIRALLPFLALLPLAAAAAETPAPEPSPTVAQPATAATLEAPGRELQRFFDVALDVSDFNYAEDFPPPGKSTENGILPSIFFFYREQHGESSSYWTLGFEFSPGGTHYDGTTQGPDYTPIQQNTANQFLRAEFDYGLAVTPWLKPYVGLGGRYWIRGASTVINGVASPSEHYAWLYLPLGLRYEGRSGLWSFAADVSLRWMFLGSIAVEFSEIDSSYEDSSGSLGGAVGGRAELPIRRQFSEHYSAQLVPWFEYSAIGKGSVFDIIQNGSVTDQGYEPASRTYQFGARAGVVYEF
jgi:hypothetical protein